MSENQTLTDVTDVPAEVVTNDGKPTDEEDGLMNTSVAPYRRLAEYLGKVRFEIKEVRTGRFAVKYKSVELYESVPNERLAHVLRSELEVLFARQAARVASLVTSVETAMSGGIDLMEFAGKED